MGHASILFFVISFVTLIITRQISILVSTKMHIQKDQGTWLAKLAVYSPFPQTL